MRSVAILCARLDADSGRIEVAKEIVLDDGSVEYNCHSFDSESLEWRAAEFGIDNINDVIDVILFEPFAAPTSVTELTHKVGRDQHLEKVREAKATLAVGNDSTKALSANLKIQDNNATRKNRMRAAGIGDAYIAAVDSDTYDVIRQTCPFESEALDVKRDHITRMRESLLAKVETPKASRIDELRRRLAGRPTDAVKVRNSVPQQVKRGELPPIILGNKG